MMSNKTLAGVFTKIYREDEWKVGSSQSGSGSDPEATVAYREAIRKFLAGHDVRSIVDYGCGDWASSRLMEWSGRDYLGLDLVEHVVERDRQQFGAPNIRFAVGDLTEDDSYSADLLICKDVLQHLPNAIIANFLAGKIHRFRWAILTNDYRVTVPGGLRNFLRPIAIGAATNSDIDPGSHHTLLLRQPPFGLKARALLRYDVMEGATRFRKEVLLWENPDSGRRG